jgi:hypothetical protein
MHTRWCHDHETWTSENWKHAWYSQMICPSCCSLHQEGLCLKNTRSLTIWNAWFQQWNTGKFYDGMGSSIVVQYSVGSVITLHDRITAGEYVDRLSNQVHPSHGPDVISEQRCNFPRQCPCSHNWNCSVTVWTAWRWPSASSWPPQSLDLNIIEPLLSVLETRVRNRFLPSTFLKQLEDVL